MLALLAFAWFFFGQGPIVDGRMDAAEWAGARTAALEGGGEVRILRRRDTLYLGIRGPAAGLATVCVAETAGIRVLHASAALGDATFARVDGRWAKRSDFVWQLRDTSAGGAAAADKAAFLKSHGWLANASAAGSPVREFRLRLTGVAAVAVAYLSTAEPMTVARWPASLADDCASVALGQGRLGEYAAFSPATWHAVR